MYIQILFAALLAASYLSTTCTAEPNKTEFAQGIYSLEETTGETAGGSSINFETKVYIFNTNSQENAFVVRDGYQTAMRYWATPILNNDTLTLVYDRCGSTLHTNFCNNKKKGDPILKMITKNGSIFFEGDLFDESTNKDTAVTRTILNISKEAVISLNE